MKTLSDAVALTKVAKVRVAFGAMARIHGGKTVPYRAECEVCIPVVKASGSIRGRFSAGREIQATEISYASGFLYSSTSSGRASGGEGLETEPYDLAKLRRVLAWEEEPMNGCHGYPLVDLVGDRLGLRHRLKPPHWTLMPWHQAKPVPHWFYAPFWGGYGVHELAAGDHAAAAARVQAPTVPPSYQELMRHHGYVQRTDEADAAAAIAKSFQETLAIMGGRVVARVDEPCLSVKLAADGRSVTIEVSTFTYYRSNPGDEVYVFFRLDEMEAAEAYAQRLASDLGVPVKRRGGVDHVDSAALSLDALAMNFESIVPRMPATVARLASAVPTPALTLLPALKSACGPQMSISSSREIGEKSSSSRRAAWRDAWNDLRAHLPSIEDLRTSDSRWAARLHALDFAAGELLGADRGARTAALPRDQGVTPSADRVQAFSAVMNLEEHVATADKAFLQAWGRARDQILAGDEDEIRLAMENLAECPPAVFHSRPAERRWDVAAAELRELARPGTGMRP